MRFLKGVIVVIAMALTINLSAQSIHFIAFANTLDRNIGDHCNSDVSHVYGYVDFIAECLGYECKLYENLGNECTKERLMSILGDVPCRPDDIVIFYYSGHGVHAAADPANLPQMCLKYDGYEQEKFVPVRVVKEMLSKRGARLNLIVTDCCNNVSRMVSAKDLFADSGKSPIVKRDINDQNFRKLFMDKKGTVILTSSKKGQVSICDPNPKNGSHFTIAFLETMDRVGIGEISPDWNQLANKVKQATLQRTGNEQEPYSEFFYSDGSTSVAINNPNPSPSQYETPDNAKQFFNKLLDSRNTLNDKLAIADNAKETIFSRNAQVRIVGKDMSTSIGLEDIETFLSRICMSKKINSIHVVRQSSDRMGKFSYLVVQEIYNE